MGIAKGFAGQSKPGDIPQQQVGTPSASAETPTGLSALFADPRVQMALLGFGSGLIRGLLPLLKGTTNLKKSQLM